MPYLAKILICDLFISTWLVQSRNLLNCFFSSQSQFVCAPWQLDLTRLLKTGAWKAARTFASLKRCIITNNASTSTIQRFELFTGGTATQSRCWMHIACSAVSHTNIACMLVQSRTWHGYLQFMTEHYTCIKAPFINYWRFIATMVREHNTEQMWVNRISTHVQAQSSNFYSVLIRTHLPALAQTMPSSQHKSTIESNHTNNWLWDWVVVAGSSQ